MQRRCHYSKVSEGCGLSIKHSQPGTASWSSGKKVKCEFLAKSHTISLNKGLSNTSSPLR